jgi:catalase (peroxidase I)
MAQSTERLTKKESVEKIKEELIPHIHETRCHPILIRLAWHDAGSYDKVRAY